MWPWSKRRRERERLGALLAERAERERARMAHASAWRAQGPVTPERVRREYEARRDTLHRELVPHVRPAAAWVLHPGEPRVDSSHMGGAPALHPGEPWPEPGYPMRFWAQLNLADLAPFAAAFGIELPGDGLLQLFAGDDGGELARYVPAADLAGFALRRDIPLGSDWLDEAVGRRIEATSLLIDLHPEALVGGDDAVDAIWPDLHGPQRECFGTQDLPGYCFGWWPLHRPGDAGAATFLAVCNSNDDLGLAYSDMGLLWAQLPTADLAAGDFTRLRCDGESG
jgi:Domain of unknown function (DUF1963)